MWFRQVSAKLPHILLVYLGPDVQYPSFPGAGCPPSTTTHICVWPGNRPQNTCHEKGAGIARIEEIYTYVHIHTYLCTCTVLASGLLMAEREIQWDER